MFVQRRDGRVVAMQYLYSWSLNRPADPADDLRLFFEHQEQPRDHYAFGEELIQGVLAHLEEIDGHIRTLAHNWEFDRIARIDLAILRVAVFEMLFRKDIPRWSRSTRRSTFRSSFPTPTRSASSMAFSTG